MKHHIRVGVLRGGPSNEYEVSLNTGASIMNAIRNHHADKYHPKDIFIDKQGNWHMDGFPLKPNDLHHVVDFVWNALHGSYGEDGKVQSLLESHNIPFSGSGSVGSAIGMNKIMSKKLFKDHGIKTPFARYLESKDLRNISDMDLHNEMFNTVLLPVVVKPAQSGSSVGVSVVRHYHEFPKALDEASKHSEYVIVEEFIPGIETTCGVVEKFRGHDLYALPPVEIKHDSRFFDYEAKYGGKSQEIVPASFGDKIKKEVEALAKKVHEVLGLRHYSRSDFIIHPRRGIFVLEVNTLPGLTESSLLPKSLRAVGSDVHELVDHIIGIGLK